MKPRIFVLFLICILALSACNLYAPNAATFTPSVNTPAGGDATLPGATAQASGTAPLPPTDTPQPLPSLTPTLTLTETLSVAMVTPKTEAVNCRFGPGTNYLSTGGLKVGATVPILGQSGDGTWWQIQNPNNIFENCWVSSLATNVTGNMASVPVTPSPLSTVLQASVNPPAAISVPGCTGPIQPIQISGVINTNGPTAVTYHFETQQSGALPSHNLKFTKYGPLTVTESYTPPLVAGTFWIKLFITAPNSVTAQSTYSITCP
jgi:hypothetical protein